VLVKVFVGFSLLSHFQVLPKFALKGLNLR
jgi:hypothetical protein